LKHLYFDFAITHFGTDIIAFLNADNSQAGQIILMHMKKHFIDNLSLSQLPFYSYQS